MRESLYLSLSEHSQNMFLGLIINSIIKAKKVARTLTG